MTQTVSIVILTCNRRKNLADLLSALRKQTKAPDEILVVDNGSTDGTIDMLQTQFSEVVVIPLPQNQGMVAYNIGLAKAKSTYILVLDDDAIPPSDWIKQMVTCLQANPRVGAIGCSVYLTETRQLAEDSPQYIQPQTPSAPGFPGVAYNGTGAGLRRAALQDVGYYPEPFYRSWLELSLCTKLLDRGWDVRIFPQIRVWHAKPSGGTVRTFAYYGLRNYLWYIWIFYPWPELLWETLHYISSRFKHTLKGHIALSLWMQALYDAWRGRRQILARRSPVQRGTLRRLKTIRRYG